MSAVGLSARLKPAFFVGSLASVVTSVEGGVEKVV